MIHQKHSHRTKNKGENRTTQQIFQQQKKKKPEKTSKNE